jgi:hypothetical protein
MTTTYAQDRKAQRCVFTIEHVQPSGRIVAQKRSTPEHDFTIWVNDPTDMYAARCSRCGIRN